MNYKSMREAVWRWMQLPTTDGRQDNILQEIREAINDAQNEIIFSTQFWWFNIRKWSLSVVANTTSYELDDWCRLPTRLWLEGVDAAPVDFISPQETDRQGLRSTSFVEGSDGPHTYTIREFRQTASYSIVGNTVVGNTIITRSSGDALVAAMVDKRLRVNGESPDYKVTAINTGANTVTVDKAYQAVLAQSDGTTGSGSNTTAGVIEISPGPVWRLDMVPTPSADRTVYYWGVSRPRYMTEDYHVPEIPEEWHKAIVALAKHNMAPLVRRTLEEKESLRIDAERMLSKMRKADMPSGGARRLYYESSFKTQYAPIRSYRLPNDVQPYTRGT
jgi:hypothetical protein